LGDSRDSIERFVEKFPIGKGLKLTTLIKKGKNLISLADFIKDRKRGSNLSPRKRRVRVKIKIYKRR